MILPTKNSNLNLSPLYVGSVILRDFSGQSVQYDQVFDHMRDDLGEFYWLITQQALNLLFLADKVLYRADLDELEIQR